MAEINNADFTPSITPGNAAPARGNYKTLHPFMMWCQKVLPLVYDESLSYYEVLCKVVDYLNKTMEDVGVLEGDVSNIYAAYDELVETMDDNVQTMLTAYENLQTYVNTYFDNLDVQEEINNKLDDMATDGTLSALISPFIPAQVTAWLNAHVDPSTGYVIDNTLTISGAAADAKVTGDKIKDLKTDLIIVNDGKKSLKINVTENDFYKGTYSTTYQPQNIESGKATTGWGIVVIHVPPEYIGKYLTVENANSQGGAASAWLNSSDPNDTANFGWSTPINNRRHYIRSEYVGVCMYNFSNYYDNLKITVDVVDELKNEISEIKNNIDTVFNTQYVKKDETTTGKYWVDQGGTPAQSNNAGYKAVNAINCPSGTYIFNDINANLTYIQNANNFSVSSLNTLTGLSGLIKTPQTITIDYDFIVYITANISLENPIWCNGTPPEIYTEGLYMLPKGIIHVGQNESADFTTLKAAIEYANQNNGIVIYVERGTYDLIEEFGEEYFNSFTSNTSESAGLQLGRNMHLIFASDSKVIANYTGANEYVPKKFSPFNKRYNNGGFILENLTLECSNCRYAIHDEDASYPDIYHNVYKNCNIKIDNSNNAQWGAKQCIGGGLGECGYIEIDGCSFNSVLPEGTENYGVVSYHNASNAGAKSNIIVKNSYFGKGQTVRASYYGTSEKITTVSVTGCGLGSAPIVTAETSGSTTVNVEIKSFANEIRNDSYVA